MNIIHAVLRYPPASGGVEDYTKQLVDRLRARGEQVRVETTSLKTHHPPTTLPLEQLEEDDAHIHRHPARTFEMIGYPVPVGLKEELDQLPMDILHAHAFWYAPADIAARAAKRRNIPFVLNPYYTNGGNRRSVKWQMYRTLYGRNTMAAADAVVVISPFEQRLLEKDRMPLQRVELIPPGIDRDEFLHERLNPFPSWKVTAKNVLLFTGRIAKAKGPDLAIRALPGILKQQPDTHLVMIGEDFGFQTACQQLAKALGVEKAITWTGKVPRETLLAAYAHASVFVFPSRYEAFGIVLLEAAAAGCPVVAPKISAIPYVVQDKHTGLLHPPEDVDALADAVVLLLQNNELRTRLSTDGRARAMKDFHWQKSIDKLVALYTDLLQKKR